jgi:monovalent cation/hydrogen antiporter
MGFSPHSHWQAITRIRRTAVWDTLRFAANGSIFVLLGEQVPSILRAAPQTVLLTGHADPWWLGLYVVVLVAALAALRFVWVWASLTVPFFGVPLHRAMSPSARWRVVLAMSIAGVRGAVTLAAVLTLPVKVTSGSPLPGRDLAIFLAAGVIVLSLVLASVALPHALKGVELPEDGAPLEDEVKARTASAHAALRAIELAEGALPEDAADADLHAQAAARIATLYRQRLHPYACDDDSSPQRGRAHELERGLRLLALRAERDEVVRIGGERGIQELTMRKLVREIDLQEARYSA